MKLTLKFGVYAIAVHAGILLSLYVFFVTGNRWWLAGVLVTCLVSLALSLTFGRRFLESIELIRSGADSISEGDFSVRLRSIGQKDADRVIGVYNQMIDRLREERVQFQEQNLFLHKLVEASPTGIIILDLDGTVQRVNQAAGKLLEWSGEPVIPGRRLDELDTPFARELAELECGVSKLIALSGRRRIKCHKDDFVDRGFRRQFLLIEELTEELRRSEKAAYDKLIRLMSHEVNNTVAATSSLLQSCREYARQLQDCDRVEFETALDVIIARSRDLNAFVRGFADVVRIPDPRRTDCDLKSLLEDVVFLMGPEFERRRVRCVWEFEKEGPFSADVDRVQFEQVFVNVFKNALEAIGEDGTVTVRVGREDRLPWVQVMDDGPGILGEAREQIFTPFFSTKRDGHGIGLTVVREILENHGCDYGLESEDGSGARFTIRFS